MTETPHSDRTVYFDAPLAHYSMSNTAVHSGSDAAKSVEQNHHHPLSSRVASRESLGWLPAIADSTATNPDSNGEAVRPADTDGARDSSNAKQSGSLAHTGSLSRRSILTSTEYRSTSPFIHGAGTTATAPPNEELSTRAASADAQLTASQKSRINKLEAKDAKRLSKIIREEGKVEKKALDVVLNELAELQNLQKKAVKDEARAHAVYAKLLDLVRKHETEYLESKARFDATEVRLHSEGQVLEKIKENAREVTEQIRVKTQELDSLRAMYSVDERERELRLMQLTGKKSSSSFWR